MAVQINVVGTYNGKELERAQRQLAQLGKDVDESKGRFKAFGGSIKSGFKAAAFGIAGAGAAIAGAGFAMMKFAQQAEEAAVANARIEQINKSMGLFGKQTEAVTKRIQDFADAQMFNIGVDDEVIKATQAKLLTFANLAKTANETGGAFDRATLAAADLAAAGFGQMEQNAVALGKALQDPVKGITALGRSGVTFTEQEKEKIKALVESGNLLSAQDTLLKAVESQVKGTAAATVTDTQKMTMAFGEISETVGTLALPAVSMFAGFLTNNLMPAFTTLTDTFKEGGIGAVFELIANRIEEAAPKVLEAIRSLVVRLGEWISTDGVALFNRYLTFMSRVFTEWILPALPGLLTKLGEVMIRIGSWVTGTLLPFVVDKLIAVGNAFFGWITPMIPVLLGKLRDVLVKIGTFLVDVAVPKVIEQAKKLGDALVSWLSPLLRTLPKDLMKFAIEIAKWILTEGVPKLADAALNLGKALLGWLPGLAVDLIAGIASAVFELVKALPGLFLDAAKAMLKLGGTLISLLIEGIKAGFVFLKGLAVDAVNVLITAFNEIPIIPNIPLIKKDVEQTTKSFEGLAEKALGTGAAATNAGTNLRLYGREVGAAGKATGEATTAALDLGGALGETDGGGGGGGGKGKGKKSVSEGAKEAADRLKDMAKSFEDSKKSMLDFGLKVGEALNEIAPAAGPSPLERAVMDLDEFQVALTGLKKATPDMAEAFKDIVDNLSERLVDSLDAAKDKLKEAKDAFSGFAKDVKGVILSSLNFADAADKEGEGAGTSFVDALTRQAKRATEFGAQIRQLVSMGLSREAIQQVLDAGQEAGSEIAGELIRGGSRAIETTNALVESATKAAEQIGEFAAAAYYQAGIDNATQQVAGLQAQINTLTPEIMATMDLLAEKMKRQVKIDVKVSQSSFNVDVFVTRHIQEVVSRQVVTIPAPSADRLAGSRAEGGPVSRMLPYLVGEQGPEIFVPRTSGMILPNGTTTGTTINLTVNAGMGTDGREVGDAIVDALTRYQRRNGAIPVKVAG